MGLTNTRTGTQWAWYAVDMVTQWASYTVDLVTQWSWLHSGQGPGYTVDLVHSGPAGPDYSDSGPGTLWTWLLTQWTWSWLHSEPGTQWTWAWLHSGPGYTVGHIEITPLPLPSQNGHWDKYVWLFTASVSVALA